MITDNQRKLLRLMDSALHDRAEMSFSQEEWTEIHQEMRAQAIYGLPANHVDFQSLSQDDLLSYMKTTGKNTKRFFTVMDAQAKCLEVLKGVPLVVLKGAAAAMYYPEPSNRCMGDIDLLVDRGHFIRAYELLKGAGYTQKNTPENFIRHIAFASPDGVEIELHEHFSSNTDLEENRVLDDLLFSGIARRETVDVCGYDVPVLPRQENGLVLLAHINHHLAKGLGLRQIIDWQCFVEQEMDEAFWPEFSIAAEKIGLKKLAVVTTAMCRKYLGLRGAEWCATDDDAICDELMAYIFAHGNFSQKDHKTAPTVNVIRLFRAPVNGLKQAQVRGLRKWKLAQKHPCLKPFAWVYQCSQWLKKGVRRGVTVSDVISSSKTEEYETDLLRKLGVTRIEG